MNDSIDYPRLVQDALRQVVRQVLTIAADAAPGTFHLYVGFNTSAPGVELPAYLRDLFPDEMRIVLQNQFWDLEVDDEGFSVMLSFNAARHRLSVPFAAMTAFYDADQDFALRFALAEAEAKPEPTPGPVAVPASGPVPAESIAAKKGAAGRTAAGKTTAHKTNAHKTNADETNADEGTAEKRTAWGTAPEKGTPEKSTAEKSEAEKSGSPKTEAQTGAKVVSLDAFRKK